MPESAATGTSFAAVRTPPIALPSASRWIVVVPFDKRDVHARRRRRWCAGADPLVELRERGRDDEVRRRAVDVGSCTPNAVRASADGERVGVGGARDVPEPEMVGVGLPGVEVAQQRPRRSRSRTGTPGRRCRRGCGYRR